MSFFRSTPPSDADQEMASRWGNRALGCAILGILVATLFPFEFFPQDTAGRRTAPFLLWLTTELGAPRDFAENILLFLPFGFGLACWARKKNWARPLTLAAVFVAGAALSYAAEFLQLFLPTRGSSWSDVVCNTTGSLIGYFFFQGRGEGVLRYASRLEAKAEQALSIQLITAVFSCYVALTFLISVPLQQATNLSTWDPSYALIFGNDPTGGRPWRGLILQAEIANRALPPRLAKEIAAGGLPTAMADALVASYRFAGGSTPPGQIEHPSDLFGIPGPPSLGPESGLVLTGRPWLGAKVPAVSFVQALQKTNQFTLRVLCAPADTVAAPFGRIVSLSQDPDHLDFVLSQKGTSLIFAFRTALTGKRGEPALVAPGIFETLALRDIALTYDGSDLFLYVDGKRDPHSIQLSPGAILVHRFRHLRAYNLLGCAVAYDMLVFAPLGFLLAIAARNPASRSLIGKILIAGSMVLPPFFLEAILVAVSGRPFRLENGALGICLTVGAALLLNADRHSFVRVSGAPAKKRGPAPC